MSHNFSIAIHGGAGTILRSSMTPELQQQYETALSEALQAGYAILEQGGSSLDAVEAAVFSMEDSPLFNAGKGSVFNNIGEHEMDAAIMYGKDRTAGAVTGVRHIKNPVQLARTIMQQSEHVILCGAGAEQFAHLHNIPFEDDAYFFTDQRYQQWQQALLEDKVQLEKIWYGRGCSIRQSW
jgi:L-asparaginase / beta-aspartyl-peptidase